MYEIVCTVVNSPKQRTSTTLIGDDIDLILLLYHDGVDYIYKDMYFLSYKEKPTIYNIRVLKGSLGAQVYIDVCSCIYRL